MSALRFALFSFLVLAIGTAAPAREEKAKIDKTKLVGTWTFVKTDSKKALPEGIDIKVQFLKDGKMKLTMKLEDKSIETAGSYSVKGDRLTTILKGAGLKEKKETVRIAELTGKRFVTTEDEDGKKVTTEFKK